MTMCDYCLRHGEGRKWYENEKNYSKELFSSRETQEFLHAYFSRSIEKTKKNLQDAFKSSNLPGLNLIVREKMERHYSENLHHQVVPKEVACQIVRMADRTCKMSCVCRKMYGDAEKYCIGLGFAIDVADKYPHYTSGIETIDKEDACNFIEDLDEKKIIHSVSALRVPYVGLICNCDLRYCAPYKLRRMGVKNAFYKSEFISEIDADRCDQCGKCKKMCLFGALKAKKEIFIDKEKCFGCGLCRTVCERKAILSHEREGLDIKEMW